MAESPSSEWEEASVGDDSDGSIVVRGDGRILKRKAREGHARKARDAKRVKSTATGAAAAAARGAAAGASVKRKKRCDTCGTVIPDHITNQHQWGASVRLCGRGQWTAADHEQYLANKGDAARGPASKAMSCTHAGCTASFPQGQLAKLRSHLSSSHGYVDAEIEAMVKPFEDPLKSLRARKAKSPVPATTATAAAAAAAAAPSTMVKLAPESESRKPSRRNGKASGYQPLPGEAEALCQVPAAVRWDDSSRTRVGLLPLEPPEGSTFMSMLPAKFHRVTFHRGGLSTAWNAFLDNERDVLFGATHAGRVHIAQRAAKSRPTGGSKDDPQSATAAEGREPLLAPPKRAPRPLSIFSLGDAPEIHRDEPDVAGLAPRFDFDSAKFTRSPVDLLPVPREPPPSPTRRDYEEALWVDEAARLIRAGAAAVRRRLATDDPFGCAGAGALAPDQLRGFEARVPRLAALQDVVSYDFVAAEAEALSERCASVVPPLQTLAKLC